MNEAVWMDVVSCSRSLSSHRRSEHAWFYNDLSLYNNHDPVVDNLTALYTLSQLVHRFNDSDVIINSLSFMSHSVTHTSHSRSHLRFVNFPDI